MYIHLYTHSTYIVNNFTYMYMYYTYKCNDVI